MIKKAVLQLIRFYQKYLNFRPFLLFPQRICRFTPSCSEYTYQAIFKYGIIKGGWKGFLRILKCHPWNKGGYDPLN